MYSFETQIRYSETDYRGKLKVNNLAAYFQDCSIKHSDSLGVGGDVLLAHDRCWVLTRWQIRINELPGIGDSVRVKTWPTGFDKLYGTRNFVMETLDGRILAWADTTWAFLDLKTKRPTRAEGPLVDAYVVSPPLQGVEYERGKIKYSEEFEALGDFVVENRYLDNNMHMNNAMYIYKAMEYLGDDFEIGQIRVDYKVSALPKEVVSVEGHTAAGVEDARTVIVFRREDGREYANMEFTPAQ